MRKLLRFLFLSNLRINLSYPLRLGFLYWSTALFFLFASYLVIKAQISDSKLAYQILKELFVYEFLLGSVLFLVTLLYSLVSSSDYRKVRKFAEEISRGNYDFIPELSSIADRDLQDIKESLLKLRKSLIISKELLKKRKSGF
jgi:hypothetical protein